MAPIGNCWASGSWNDNAWAAGTWVTRVITTFRKSRFFKRFVQPHGSGVKRRA